MLLLKGWLNIKKGEVHTTNVKEKWCEPLWLYIDDAVTTNAYELVEDRGLSLEQVEAWLGKIDDHRKGALKDVKAMMIQVEKLPRYYVEIFSQGVAERLQAIWAFFGANKEEDKKLPEEDVDESPIMQVEADEDTPMDSG